MDNRENIICHALNLFSSRGYDSVGVQEICDVCEITKPTLYHYFTNKRGLLDIIMAEYFVPFVQKVKNDAEYRHNIVVNLESIAMTFFQFAKDEPQFNRFSISAIFSPPENDVYDAQQKYSQEIFNDVENLFRLAVKDHGNMKNKEQQLALSFVGLLHIYIVLFFHNQTTLDDSIARAVVKQFMHGIFS